MTTMGSLRITGPLDGRAPEVLTDEALRFVAELERRFRGRRDELLERRRERRARLAAGELPRFGPETREVREGDWRVAPPPPAIRDRRVEITGPVERKMMINAFNSGARVFMADFEDANSPTWRNTVEGQANLFDAVRGTIAYTGPDGREYRLGERVATLFVRPRGWHLPEKHAQLDGRPMTASLFDVGLHLFWNGRELERRGMGPFLYLPKLESHLEARLWNDVLGAAEEDLGLARGSVRATVLIETAPAAFEMDEILYELRERSAGLNAGRWDYMFSFIKCFRERPEFVLPDRIKVTMTVPFMRAYTELLVRTCHRRGAHAMGGMAAFIPSRKRPEINERALAAVRDDKLREAGDGFDGTWVAHPDLVPVAMEVFDGVLGERPNQVDRLRDDVSVTERELLDVAATGGEVTDDGLRNDVSVAIQYISSWLSGNGAVAIFDLMEDAATAEIARSQVWQWIRHGARTADGAPIDRDRVRRTMGEELERIRQAVGPDVFRRAPVEEACALFEQIALGEELPEFLTLPAYELLE